MRKSLLWAVLLLSLKSYGQYVELGLGGGICLVGQPTGNMYYKGNESAINPSFLGSLLYNTINNVQIGAELRVHPLVAYSTQPYTDAYIGHQFGGSSKKVVYADYMTDFTVILNKKLALNQTELYAGVAAGIAHTNGNKTLKDGELYQYPDGGLGSSLGMQVGVDFLASSNFAINFEAAARFYDIRYGSFIDARYAPREKIHGSIVAFPVAITFRYRFLGNNRSGVDRRTGQFDMDRYQRRNRIYPKHYNW